MLTKTRVCIVCPDLDPALFGNSKMAWGLANELMKSGITVHIITNGSETEIKRTGSYELLKLPFTSKSIINNFPKIRTIRTLLTHYFNDTAIDVIHGHGIFSSFLTVLIKEITGKPTVQTINGLWPIYKIRNFTVPMPNILKYNFTLPFIDAVVCSNTYVKQFLLDAMVPLKRLTVVRYGLEEKWIQSNTIKEASTTKHEVVFFGDGTNERGLSCLLRAIPIVSQSLPRTHFTLAIRDWQPLFQKMGWLATKKYPITVLEYPLYSNMLDVVSSANVVALPFLVNSMEPPLSLIESLALAKPVVTSDIGGNREFIGDNERGILVKPNDHRQLAEAILQLLSDAGGCLKLGSLAREFITAQYNWEKAITALTTLYTEIC